MDNNNEKLSMIYSFRDSSFDGSKTEKKLNLM